MNYGKRRRNDMSLLDALNEPQRQAVMATGKADADWIYLRTI